jgi:hypothetical protein
MGQVELKITLPDTGPHPQSLTRYEPGTRNDPVSPGDGLYDTALWRWGPQESVSNYLAGVFGPSRYSQPCPEW